MKCQNCGSAERADFPTDIDGEIRYLCMECGTSWRSGHGAFIPRRSLPPEIKSLPDAEGWWLQRRGPDWQVIRVYPIGTQLCWGGEPCIKGEYVRFVPPILPPEIKLLPDAEGWWYEEIEMIFHNVRLRPRITSDSVYHPVGWVKSLGTSYDLKPGRYVRAVPPILPPEQPKDVDWRERVGHYMCEAANLSVRGELQEAIHAMNFAVGLLADRLDKAGAK